jgi:cytochrome P450 family 135
MLPPGPRAPRAVQMFEWVARPIPFLERCRRRYGDMFTARFLIGDIVFISDPGLIKQVFTGDPEVLHAGEGNAPVLEPIVGSNSVLLLDGPEHLRQRKLMLPSFHGERMQRYGDLIAEITEADIERWPRGTAFPLRQRTQAITLEVIMRAVFGIEDVDRLADLRDRLGRLLDLGSNRFAITAIALVPLRRTVGRRLWERFARLRAETDELLYDEMARRRADPRTPERDDVMSVLLQARDEQGSALTDAELRDELMTLLVAGHETTATALAWTFDLLVHNPATMSRLEEEVASEPDGPYLDAVIKEALRMRPVLPGVVRKLTAPWRLDGYDLPVGVRVAPNIWLTHHRADVYPQAETFRPERFLERPADTYSWIPFGGGIRRCLGASFALYEMKTVLPTVLRRLRLAPGSPRPDTVKRRAITFAPEHDAMVVAYDREPGSASTPGREAVLAYADPWRASRT